MAIKDLSVKKARFDTRLSEEQKVFFERAAQLGGFRNLTDFVVSTVQERAKEIISESERVIASKRDGELFFDAISNAKPPNDALRNAANDFKTLFAE